MFYGFSALSIARTLGAFTCVALMCLNLFGNEDWHLWVAHVGGLSGMVFLLFAPHALLPLLPPSLRGLALTVLLYTLVWALLWYQYEAAVAADPMNADSRGTTGGLFLFSNLAFVAGLLLRLASAACSVLIQRLNAKRREHAA
jgi:hypothetical protein